MRHLRAFAKIACRAGDHDILRRVAAADCQRYPVVCVIRAIEFTATPPATTLLRIVLGANIFCRVRTRSASLARAAILHIRAYLVRICLCPSPPVFRAALSVCLIVAVTVHFPPLWIGLLPATRVFNMAFPIGLAPKADTLAVARLAIGPQSVPGIVTPMKILRRGRQHRATLRAYLSIHASPPSGTVGPPNQSAM